MNQCFICVTVLLILSLSSYFRMLCVQPPLCCFGLHPSSRDSLVSHIPPHHFLPVCTVSASSHSVATLICNTEKLTPSASRLPTRTPAMPELSEIAKCKVLCNWSHGCTKMPEFLFFLQRILTSEAGRFSGEWPFTPAHIWALLLYEDQKYFMA